MKDRLKAALARLGVFRHGYEWAIGMYAGPLTALRPVRGLRNPVLRAADVDDVPAVFVADPFMLRAGDGWHMFFEVLNGETGRGEIGLARSDDGQRWRYHGIVLTEPHHLSYPYVFAWEGDTYMVPEASAAGAISLYRATSYPLRWEPVAPLLTGKPFSDASLFRHGDRWWLLTAAAATGALADTLHLYHAARLEGPWQQHPASPVIRGDARCARPAGRVVADEGRIVRFAQDCRVVYGAQVSAFEITELSTTTYRERPLVDRPVLAPGAGGWNGLGMHHLDPHHLGAGEWLACVDGRPLPGLQRPRLP